MDLFNIKSLPIFIRTGKFALNGNNKKNSIKFSTSREYNTKFYPKKKFHKPIIF